MEVDFPNIYIYSSVCSSVRTHQMQCNAKAQQVQIREEGRFCGGGHFVIKVGGNVLGGGTIFAWKALCVSLTPDHCILGMLTPDPSTFLLTYSQSLHSVRCFFLSLERFALLTPDPCIL